MIELKIHSGKGVKVIFSNEKNLTTAEIWNQLKDNGFAKEAFYILQNGRIVSDDFTTVQGYAELVPRILGGKGGFGSMLRAIGAQIEKTTNREACRDLSGRRLRDINEEKRLKAWIEKQESREEEEVERKKRKLQKLCAVPKHEFKDKKYEEERSGLTNRVGDAVEEGFKMAAATAAAFEIEQKIKLETKSNKRKTILDDDMDSDETNTSDDSDSEDANPRKKLAINDCRDFSDSGCSSEESRKACHGSDRSTDDNSMSSCVNRISDSGDSSSNDKNSTDMSTVNVVSVDVLESTAG